LARQIIVPTRNIAVRLGDNAQFDGIECGFYQNLGLWSLCLGRVDAAEAVGKLIVSRCDAAVDLEVAKHALDAVALTVEEFAVTDHCRAVGLRLKIASLHLAI
jgi:hypothetical protein